MVGKRGIRSELFTFNDTPHIVRLVLGSEWAKDFPVEKGILDQLIALARHKVIISDEILSYLIPQGELRKKFGIRLNLHDSELFSNEERKLLSLFLQSTVADVNPAAVEGIDGIDRIQNLQNTYMVEQRKLRQYKDSVEACVTRRIESVYKPFKGARRERERKTPIRVHLERVKREDPSSLDPQMILNLTKVNITLSSMWSSRLTNEQIAKAISESLPAWVSTSNASEVRTIVEQIVINFFDLLSNKPVDEV